jgi:glycosyltransferase involved in cell wall biosynthesis
MMGEELARVCLFIPNFGDGGVERMMVNIARGVSGWGFPVDFIVNRKDNPFLDRLPPQVRVYPLETDRSAKRLRLFLEYLRQNRPQVVLSSKNRDDAVAVAAKAGFVDGECRFFLRPATAMSQRFALKGKHRLLVWWETRKLARLYRAADGIVAVSAGVADDIARLTGVSREGIRVIRNPTITPELEEQARAPLAHPWFRDGQPPVVMGVGGLRAQKDFPTLISAFALLRERMSCHLLILGKGRQRERLLRQARFLGIAADVQLPGFDENPYRYLSRAKLFVLSSRWEGSPNVLTEALALGIPSVSSDCPYGPREITDNGRVAPLVPVGDAPALARAMHDTLQSPLPADVLKSAVAEYRLEISSRRYLAAFGLVAETV